MPENSLSVKETDGILIVGFGDITVLDSSSVQNISRRLLELPDRHDQCRMVLDFDEVTMITSQVLGILITLHKKCNETDGRFIIAGLQPRLRKIFHITRLERILEFADNTETALARLRDHSG
ncbi:MAG: STAS domain-containing protein [Phycisphaerae bacterium]